MAAAVASLAEKASSSFCSQFSISSHTSHLCRKRTFFATCSSRSGSPFTERHSVKPLRGGGKLDLISTVLSCRKEENPQHGQDCLEFEQEHDIATRLPELRQLLSLLHKDERKQEKAHGVGNVFLVGTGPGDPDLLTVKALKLMQTADLVLYDRLVSTDILELVHAGARLLYVGKTAGYHSRTQDEIHQLLLSFAEAGATVLRLKGGDPLVFGRGGEEMDFLQQQGVQVRVVPGITAASGIAAELGIPLTHRGAANSVRFLTGHSRKGGIDPLFIQDQAADPDSTLVVYMGLSTLPSLAARLINSGLPSDTPSAAVERGTTAYQRTVFAELHDLPSEVVAAKLESPTLIFIGRVVALSPSWPGAALNQESTTMTTTSLPPAMV
ncbi:hypothetical protein GOP47_0023694 [Adiantum capillus-veneris]|uniref:uroporphyrinogen-III C-methyltransferase n=1 Tax=Adiantum capillus-veneris TaxID=13818 RepID=A0A9D4U3X7_ADICA|nr:hypothetical protein GOP47_0023694 [Adiantum capillus-veneris]